jgi:hypothetical protein
MTGPTQGCGTCTNTTINSGCSAATCWQREIAFTVYTSDPGYGSFSEIYHCFQGGGNVYQRTTCSTYGDPTNLGFVANSAVGSFATPVYLCQWVTSGITDQFFTLSTSECSGVSGTLIGGGAFGYVAP